jgi:4-hydroxy-tetrahydrodipicolinate synthase
MAFCQQGAVGVVSVAGHWAAPEFQQLIRATRGGDLKEAESLRALLEESCTFEGTEEYPNPMPSKAAMRYLGFAVGECRLPHAPSDDVLNTRAAAVVSALHGRRG